jgi:hypothetical protein
MGSHLRQYGIENLSWFLTKSLWSALAFWPIFRHESAGAKASSRHPVRLHCPRQRNNGYGGVHQICAAMHSGSYIYSVGRHSCLNLTMNCYSQILPSRSHLRGLHENPLRYLRLLFPSSRSEYPHRYALGSTSFKSGNPRHSSVIRLLSVFVLRLVYFA